ncbi:MAG: amidohydrolase [Proteobacteria bacterium]|nr:amidohydrolase [Pseudomonadota bacterium]
MPVLALAAGAPPEVVYVNGRVFTGLGQGPSAQALAVRDGRILATGSDASIRALTGPGTRVVDLGGRFLMPGLIDGHLHPLEGGQKLVKCNLNYERLTVAQLQARIQKCLDDTRAHEPDDWLVAVNWFREAMIPRDAVTTLATLDVLKTSRPILVASSFGHSALVNTRALKVAKIDAHTPDPGGGRIDHDAHGSPSGILEDTAYERTLALVPAPTPAEDDAAARTALRALAAQGVTSFLDAEADDETISAFARVQRAGGLTGRAHFAVVVQPEEAQHPDTAVARVKRLAQAYDQGAPKSAPGLQVRNIKLFLDGVISAPEFTGAMVDPYFENVGTAAHPRWVPGKNRGPEVYFAPEVLKGMVLAAARAGFGPHMHCDGDRAVRAALDAIQALRREFPESVVRAAIAHDEAVHPDDFPRFKELGAIAVLSFQWEKRAPDSIDNDEDFLGPERFRITEPAGLLAAAGARIAFGSDWPVDPLNEWFALKVAVTRENAPDAGAKYQGRLGDDPGLTALQALNAITVNAAYELHAENEVGTLEPGKLADFIVLDRDPLAIEPRAIAATRVLLTVVGGRSVHASAPFTSGAP